MADIIAAYLHAKNRSPNRRKITQHRSLAAKRSWRRTRKRADVRRETSRYRP